MLTHQKIEKILVGAVFLIGLLVLTWLLYYRNFQYQYGDSTFASQLVYNFRDSLKFETSFSDSTVYSVKNIWYKPAEYVCSSPLVTAKEYPWFHYYLIAPLLGLVSKFFDIYVFMAFLMALIYASVLLFVYALARKLKIEIIPSLLLVLITTQQPLWSMGLYGQFYFNRLFYIFCGMLLYLLLSKKKNYWLILLFSLLAIATNEVNAIALAMVLVVYGLFVKFDKKILGLSLFSFLMGVLLIFLVQKNIGGGTTQTGVINQIFSGGISGFFNNVKGLILEKNSEIFLLVNFIFGGFLLIKSRLFFGWIFLLTPNLLSYVGKLGWSTHYHTTYFIPVLFLYIYQISKIKFKNKYFLPILLSIYFVVLTCFDYLNIKFTKPSIVVKNIINDLRVTYKNREEILGKIYKLKETISDSDRISLPESIAYPFLKNNISYYPMDIDKADKVILYYDDKKDGNSRFYSINYGHQAENLDDCILKRMNKNGFDLKNPIIIGNLAIISKK